MTWVWGLLLVLALAAVVVVGLATLLLKLLPALTFLLAVLLSLLLLIVLLLTMPVTLEVHYKREGKDDRLHLGVRTLFGLVRVGYDVPIVALMERQGKFAIKKDPAEQMPDTKKGWVTITVEKIQEYHRRIQRLRKRLGKYKRAIRRMTRTFQITQFRWRTMFGTGDAADTATIAGLVWGLKGLLAGNVYKYFRVEERLQYDVKPHFQAKGFRTEFVCIIRFWVGKAMFAGLTLVFLWLREGMKWRNIRSKA